jgi:hypothetical protein
MFEAMWAILKLGLLIITLPLTGLFVLLGAGDWESALTFSLLLLGGLGTAAATGTAFIQSSDGKLDMFRWWNYK